MAVERVRNDKLLVDWVWARLLPAPGAGNGFEEDSERKEGFGYPLCLIFLDLYGSYFVYEIFNLKDYTTMTRAT